MSTVVSIITYYAQDHIGAMSPMEGIPLSARLDNMLVSYCRYIYKLFWPVDLAILYPYAAIQSKPLIIACSLAVLLLFLFCLSQIKRRPYLIVGYLWYIGSLIPAIGLVQVGAQSMADRFTYVPSIGLFIMLAWGINDLVRAGHLSRQVVVLVAFTSFTACYILTSRQIGYWQNTFTLFQHAAAITSNNSTAHSLVGQCLLSQRQYADAASEFVLAAKREPMNPQIQIGLAKAMLGQGRTRDAIAAYYLALRNDPTSIEAELALALILAIDPDSTLRNGSESLRLAERACLQVGDPTAFTLMTLGLAYAEAGRYPEAIASATEARRLSTKHKTYRLSRLIDDQVRAFEKGLPFRHAGDLAF